MGLNLLLFAVVVGGGFLFGWLAAANINRTEWVRGCPGDDRCKCSHDAKLPSHTRRDEWARMHRCQCLIGANHAMPELDINKLYE
jgi:hypothetical protein